MNGNKEKVYIMTFTKTTFNGDLLVLGSRWSGSWRRLVSTVNQFLFDSLQFPHVICQLLSMQLLLLVLERSIRRQYNFEEMKNTLIHNCIGCHCSCSILAVSILLTIYSV